MANSTNSSEERFIEVAVGILQRAADGKVLMGKRSSGAPWAGYWEFPGGKLLDSESPKAALVRELEEELGIEVQTATPWMMQTFLPEQQTGEAPLRLHFFRIRTWRGDVQNHVHSALSWQDPQNLCVAPLLPRNSPVLAALRLPTWYGISHANEIGPKLQLQQLAKVLEKGMRLVQLREEKLPTEIRNSFVVQALALCRSFGARCLINTDSELARSNRADGLHLPAAVWTKCNKRPDFPLLGVSCHNGDELSRAAKFGADFAVLGPVLITASHPGHAGLDWDQTTQILAKAELPVYVIGGLKSQDMARAQAAGAHGIAAIRSSWDESWT